MINKIKITCPLLAVIAVALAFDENGWIVLFLAAAGVHECGHLAAILLFKGKIQSITAGLGGMKIEYTAVSQMSYTADAAIAFAGPFFSFAAAGITAAFCDSSSSSDLLYFCGINLVLACFNLIPAAPLDGGRVARAVLLIFMGPDIGEKAAGFVSVISCWVLCAAGIGLLCFTRCNASLLFAGLLILNAVHFPAYKSDKAIHSRLRLR